MTMRHNASITESELWNFTPRKDDEHENDSDEDSVDDTHVSSRSTALRAERSHEYLPVPVGGYAVYYNKHEGAQNRTRIPSALNPEARGKKALNVLKFGEDVEYKPFLLMLEHGIPLAAVWDKAIEAGLDPAHLLDDCEGPAINQQVRDPIKEEEDALHLFVERVDSEAAWRSHQTDWKDMQRSSVGMADAPLLPSKAGIIQKQRVERSTQNTHSELNEQLAAEGHKPFIPYEDNINNVSSSDRQINHMRTNFPNVFSSMPVAYKTTRGSLMGVSFDADIWGNNRKKVSYSETEFWRDIHRGSMREGVGTYGASKGTSGYSLAVGSRVPITWKTEKEILDSWEKNISS